MILYTIITNRTTSLTVIELLYMSFILNIRFYLNRYTLAQETTLFKLIPQHL